MSMELSFLVIERAALKGHDYRALLYLSMKANDYDFVRTSVRALAFGMRMSETRSRLALKQLEAMGYILRLRYGASRNPYSGYYAIRREHLMVMPKLDCKRKQFGDRSVAQWRRELSERSPGVIAERDRRLNRWRRLPDVAKRSGADGLFFDPEKAMRAQVEEGVERMMRILDAAAMTPPTARPS
jgi:hypothetical protein